MNGPSGAYSVLLLSDATFRRFTRLRCGWVGHYDPSAGAKRRRIASDVTSDPVVRRPVALLCAELGQWVTYILGCSDGDTNALCYAVEAVFLHGLKAASCNKPSTWVGSQSSSVSSRDALAYHQITSYHIMSEIYCAPITKRT